MKFIEPKEQDWSVKIKEDGKEFQARPSLVLNINIRSVTSGKRQNEIFSNFEKAFSMISQTRIGQYLMEKAISAGAEIIVDDNEFVESNITNTAFVMNGDVYINSDISPAQLANVLVHEFTHVMQNNYEAKGKYLHDLRLDQAIQLEWGLEAEAYASTAQFAAEFSRGDPKSPVDAWKSNCCLEELKKEDSLAHLLAQTISDEDLYSGKHMMSQFLLFYSNSWVREAYAEKVVDYFERAANDLGVVLGALSFRKKLDGVRLKDEFNYIGRKYLTEHAKDVDVFSGRYYSSVPSKVKKRLLDFYGKLPRLTHFFQKKAIKIVPTHKRKDIELRLSDLEQALKKYKNNHSNNKPK